MVVTACFGVFFYGQQLGDNAGKKKHAVLLAKEGMEAMRAIRNHADALPDDGTYGLYTGDTTWQLIATPDTPQSGFTRTITVETVDAYTKKVSVNIAWQQTTTREGSFSIIGYLTPWTAVIDDTP
jgi:hypothetical protein